MKFREYTQNQIWLIPPNIEDEIPKNDIVRVIDNVIDEIHISEFEKKYKEVGNIAFDPRLMLKILLYSYQQGIFSSRKIEKESERNIYYWYLTGKETPNFRTICKFIKRHKKDIETIFSQVLLICQSEGLIDLETVAIDGSMIKANASRDASWDLGRVDSELSKIQKNVGQMLDKAIEIDEIEDQLAKEKEPNDKTRPNIPKILDKLKKLQDTKTKLKKNKKTKHSTTDPDAILNGRKGKPKEMVYNSNIVVESKNQIIVAADVTNQMNEHVMVPTQMERIQSYLGETPKHLLGDAAYAKSETISYLISSEITPLMPNRQIKFIKAEIQGCFDHIKNYKYASQNFKYYPNNQVLICPNKAILTKRRLRKRKDRVDFYEYGNPKACYRCNQRTQCTRETYRRVERGIYQDAMDQAQKLIRTPEGYKRYKQRMAIVEPVFANIKWNKSFKTFTFRGLNNVKAQFQLACIAHNIEKLFKKTSRHFINQLCQLFSLDKLRFIPAYA